MEFVKGHGTENDFLVLPDDDARTTLDAARVALLCDRSRGLGADGVLRVATVGALIAGGVLDERVLEASSDGAAAPMTPDDWFMDYRNADGSIAEMCGNGVRVFAHFLRASGRVTDDRFVVGTRAGGRVVQVDPASDGTNARVSVGMGAATIFGTSSARVRDRELRGLAIDVGNPHLACVLDGPGDAGLAALDLASAPAYDTTLFPSGVNVEVVTALRDGGVRMRVHERGVGETRSCGTGTVAAALAALIAADKDHGTVEVTVPGGDVTVTIVADGQSMLEGPSVLVASGEIDDQWWRGVTAARDGAMMESR